MSEFNYLGEFSNPALEGDFLAEDWGPARKRMRFICLVTSVLYLFAALADYGDLGPGPAFHLLLCARSAVFLFGLGCYGFLCRRSAPDRIQNILLCGYMSAIMACECLELGLKASYAGPMSIPGTIFIVLAYYLFIPPRLFVPLVAGVGGTVAYLATLFLATPAPVSSALSTALFFALANLFGIYYMVNFGRSRRREFQSMRQLREQADYDDLTGVCNRRRTLEAGEALFVSARRYETPFSVLMLDVDRFKQINDRYGHAAGDAVLRELATRCRNHLREVDVFGRLGGEEFAALLPHSGLAQARTVAERIRSAVCTEPFMDGKTKIQTTVSIGVQTMIAEEDERFSSLLRRADNELYQAKQGGRNRVCPPGAAPSGPAAKG
jgi:diguanylate cyclase (GGDEF)-like protein